MVQRDILKDHPLFIFKVANPNFFLVYKENTLDLQVEILPQSSWIGQTVKIDYEKAT